MTEMGMGEIIGQSKAVRNVFTFIKKVAKSDATILVQGETGTGKGMVAQAIHDASPRSDKPFVAINCGAIPENLLESELFGHVKGSFTGAVANKTGKFEQAHTGTIFLDEIGDMSPDLQVKVLRVLEENEFEPVGSTKTVKVDIRVVAATHRDLEKRIEEGLFREDLYYRLYVIPIVLPPLRDRKSDIQLLAGHFQKKISAKNKMDISGFTQSALDALTAYHWPGNVRELKNLVERLVVLSFSGTIDVEDLPAKIRDASDIRQPSLNPFHVELADEGISLNTALTEFEKALILQSLEKTKWVKNKAAKLLNMKRTTLVEKIKRHQLSPPEIACGAG